MAGQLREGDIGSVIRVQVLEYGVPLDASAVLSQMMHLQRPSGAVLARPAQKQTDGSDGIFVYTTVAGDLSETGSWVGQVLLQFATGQWHTDPFTFMVGEALEPQPSDGSPPYVPPAAALPTAPVGQVLVSRGIGVPPTFDEHLELSGSLSAVNVTGRSDFLSYGNMTVEGSLVGGSNLDLIGSLGVGGNVSFYGGSLSVERSVSIGETALANTVQWPYAGTLININDSTTDTPGAVITGGGSFHVLARWNGTVWKVVA